MKEKFMDEAIKEAKKSVKTGDVPVGAVVVKDGKIIARAHNTKEKKQCAVNHAEVLAIIKASKKIGNFRLDDCDIYVTKEPCLMCIGAILSARIRKIYFGAFDKKFGAIDFAENNNFNHKSEHEGGIKKDTCEKLLSNFFKEIRACKSK